MSNRARQVSDLLAALDGVYGASSSDRRRATRVPFESPLVIHPRKGDFAAEPTTVLLQDFSIVGLGLVSQKPMQAGSEFRVDLQRDGQGVSVTCGVAHCRPATSGRFRIGAQFLRIVASPPRDAHLSEPLRLDWLDQEHFPPEGANEERRA